MNQAQRMNLSCVAFFGILFLTFTSLRAQEAPAHVNQVRVYTGANVAFLGTNDGRGDSTGAVGIDGGILFSRFYSGISLGLGCLEFLPRTSASVLAVPCPPSG
jgi:hypothetical protein